AAGLRTIVIEHEQPNGGGEIPLPPAAIDAGHEIRKRHVARRGDFLEAPPKGVLEAHAGFVTGDDDRAFDDRRLHRPSSVSRRCASSSRRAFSACASSNARSAFERPWASRFSAARTASSRRFAALRVLRRLTISPISPLDVWPRRPQG